MPLTDAQIARFQERGYLVSEDVVPAAHVKEMHDRIDAITSATDSDDAWRMRLAFESDDTGPNPMPAS